MSWSLYRRDRNRLIDTCVWIRALCHRIGADRQSDSHIITASGFASGAIVVEYLAMPIGSAAGAAVVECLATGSKPWADKQGRDRNRPRTFRRGRLPSHQGSAIKGRGSRRAAAAWGPPITRASRVVPIRLSKSRSVKLLKNNNLTTINIRNFGQKSQ